MAVINTNPLVPDRRILQNIEQRNSHDKQQQKGGIISCIGQQKEKAVFFFTKNQTNGGNIHSRKKPIYSVE